MTSREHWEKVYTSKGPNEVSWFRPHLERSIAFLEATKLGHDAATEQEFVYCYWRLPARDGAA